VNNRVVRGTGVGEGCGVGDGESVELGWIVGEGEASKVVVATGLGVLARGEATKTGGSAVTDGDCGADTCGRQAVAINTMSSRTKRQRCITVIGQADWYWL
jgi:hypothetical protein